MTNPLLQTTGLPAFSRITPEDIVPAIDNVLAENRALLDDLLANKQQLDWDTLVPALDEMDEKLHRAWSPVTHLNAVKNNMQLRKAYNAALPKLTDYETELGQHPGLYKAFQRLADSNDYAKLTTAQQKYILDELRDFKLSGVHLPDDKKVRFKQIMQRLAELSTRYEENLLDATAAWELHITDADRLRGIPANDLQRFADRAAKKEYAGWLLTLDAPSFLAVITHADDRQLRQTLYRAFVTRASDQTEDKQHDNAPLMTEILALRQEAASLLNFDNFAEYSLTDKMAESAKTAFEFLSDLITRIKPRAAEEMREMQTFARDKLGIELFQAWDKQYTSEKMRLAQFDLDQEKLRPYFPVPRVLDGLFNLVNRLYGVRIIKKSGADTWHPDVQFFQIIDSDGSVRGELYVDLYARPEKRSGAWMDEALNRKHRAGGLQHPVAHLVCNFAPPLENQPAQLTHDDVLTLFHECGHCLHHLMTQVDVAGLAGINGVEWDAVELPSQFMENFAWHREVIEAISQHIETGEPLPDELFDRLLRSKNFQTGLHLVRQLEFALFDMRLHTTDTPVDVTAVLDQVRSEVSVAPVPDYNRFANSFSHIFAGGYAAGYYSYLWAEVMSSDAFAAFEEQGVFNPDTGQHFLHSILEKGGSKPAGELFHDFRGRAPDIAAFLRHNALCH